jgi:glycosyltransferase involved in cell wall biosynthesis
MVAISMPKLAVIIPVYNCRTWIREAVLSIQSDDTEVIVVDDASVDNSLETIADLRHVRLCRHEVNQGGAAAQNTGIRASTAPWSTFLDADDKMDPSGLRYRLKRIDAHPRSNSEHRVFGGLPGGLIDSSGAFLERLTPKRDRLAIVPRLLSFDFYRESFYPPGSSFYCYPRMVFEQAGLFNEALRFAYDYEHHLRILAALGPIEIHREPTILRRMHSSHLSIDLIQSGPGLRSAVVREAEAVRALFNMGPLISVEPWETLLKELWEQERQVDTARVKT